MAGVHEDFGEKIGGAKKDLWKDRGLYADDLEAMNEREAEKFVKKDNVWKKPDYAAMLEEGIPLGVVYFIKKARDGLNASPQYYRTDDTPEKRTARQKEYIKTVRELQTVLSDVRTVEDAVRAYDRFFVDNGYLEKVQGWGSGIHYRATKKGQDNPVITNKLSNTMLIRSAEYFERNFTQKAKKEQFCVSKEQKIPKGYAIHFNDGKHTYSKNEDWKPGTYYVTKGYSILRTNFETKEAALKWVQELAKGRNKNGKIRFVPPQLAHVKRTGPDYRNGVEITGQHYLDTFGFRGGEFGNWMNQNDRQTSLNMGFEALKDLASALKISDPYCRNRSRDQRRLRRSHQRHRVGAPRVQRNHHCLRLRGRSHMGKLLAGGAGSLCGAYQPQRRQRRGRYQRCPKAAHPRYLLGYAHNHL